MSGPSDRRYSVDTSALIDGLERYYPVSVFPALWEKIDELISEGRFFMSEEVWEELQAKDEPAKEWAKPRLADLIVPTNKGVALAVQGILAQYELLTKNMKGRNRADPFVIAVAQLLDAEVVTGEGSDGTATRPKIPFVCSGLSVPCIRFLDLIRFEHWAF